MIAQIAIDLVNRKVYAWDEDHRPVLQPASPSGRSEIKFTKTSAGGLIIQALVRMIENREGRV